MDEIEQQPAATRARRMNTRTQRRHYDTVKRGIDVCLSVFGLIITAPLQAVVAVVVLVVHGRPVLFRQPRPGRGGKVFDILKFRTMLHPDADHITDGQRLTRLGRFLRASSLDELPSLWNVACGEMSLVGPRPLRVEYLDRYTPEQSRRHETLPGITGLAQVRGRNDLDWDDKFRLDVEYVDTRCLRLDLLILLQTVQTVLGRQGISKGGFDTMPTFTGERDAGNGDS